MNHITFAELFRSLIDHGYLLLNAWDLIGSSFSFPLIEFLFALDPFWSNLYFDLIAFVDYFDSIPIIGNILERYYMWILEDVLYFSFLDLVIYCPVIAVILRLITKIWDALPMV